MMIVNEENVLVITDRKELYDKCENMEQLFDKYYLPLLDKHYSKTYKLQQENARLKDKNDKIEKWLKYKAEALDTFDIPKRKETGAFWFTTRGEIDGLLELLKEN